MARPSRALTRAAFLTALALVLQGSTCHVHYCSGDCGDRDEEDDEPKEMVVLPPFRDPLGRPLTGPIILPVDASRGSDR